MNADTGKPIRSGYCTATMCNEHSDEMGPFALCAYHRDFPEEGAAA